MGPSKIRPYIRDDLTSVDLLDKGIYCNFKLDFHRLGHKGKVDVKLQPGIPTGRGTSGGGCYPDHLPVLAHVPEEAAPAAGTIRGAAVEC